MKCEKCGLDIMKGDYFCRSCAFPNPRNEYAAERLKRAVIGAVETMGVDVRDAEGVNGETAWKEFELLMWPTENQR